jgi:hypothetical protein
VREVAAVLFFLALAVLATWPLASGLSRQTLVGPDPMIDLWTVHWLSGHLLAPGELFGGNIFHPDSSAVLYSDLSLGTAILLAPLRALVSDPVPLYNLGLLLALAFAGWSFHALVRELTGSRWAGLLSGVLAAFGSHQLSHVYHLNLLTTGWLALLLLALHRLLRPPRWPAVLLAGASFALSAQSSGYYAVAAALLPLLFAAVHWRAFRDRRVAGAALAAALVGATLIAPYAHAFRAVRARESLRRPPGMSEQMAFQPTRDLTSYGLLYRGLLGSEGERLFPGLLSLALAAAALARRRPGSGFYTASAGAFLLLSLGPQLEMGAASVALPYRWLFALPPLDAMRHPYTFAAVATFLLAVLAGLGWSALPLARRRWAGPLVVALAMVETLAPAPSLRNCPPGLPAAYRVLEHLPPGAVLEVPVSVPEALLWAARHGRPTANGIGAFQPRLTSVLDRYVQNHWVRQVPADVDASPPTDFLAERTQVRYVIVPSGRRPALRALAEAFDRSRAFVRVAEVEGGDRLYELRRDRLPDAGQRGEEPDEVLGQEAQPVGHQQ